MDLYIDSYITNSRLNSKDKKLTKIAAELSDYRRINYIYKEVAKEDIFKYTLLSYSSLNFERQFINYELDNKDNYCFINEFIKSIFPNAVISNKRSKDLSGWLFNIKKFSRNGWCFFSPNNDHPYISPQNYNFKRAIAIANQLRYKNNNTLVTIPYSHHQEYMNSHILYEGLYGNYGGIKSKYYEDQDFLILETSYLSSDSVGLYHWNDLEKLFGECSYHHGRVVRLEDLPNYLSKKRTLIVVPKIELCRHYDGYSHTELLNNNPISLNLVRPLFFPQSVLSQEIRKEYMHEKIPYSMRFKKFSKEEILEFKNIYNTQYNAYKHNINDRIRTVIRQVKLIYKATRYAIKSTIINFS